MKDQKHIKYGLFSSILITLGPILWLFINIYDKKYDPIVLNEGHLEGHLQKEQSQRYKGFALCISVVRPHKIV